MEPARAFYYRDKLLKVIEAGNPYKVAWQVTRRCNLRCKQCYADAQTEPGAAENEMTLDEGKRLMDDLASMGECSLVLTGGEPLLREEIFEITDYAARKGLSPKIATNGTLVTKDVARRLKDAGAFQVHVSLDGPDAPSHETIRRVAGAFERTLEGIRHLQQAGLPVIVGITIMRSNYDQVIPTLRLAADLKATVFTFNDMEPCGRGACEQQSEDITPEEREDLYQRIHAESVRLKDRIYVDKFDPGMWHRVRLQNAHDEAQREALLSLGEAMGGCPAGRWVCLISSVGEVRPCAFFPMVVGNVREQSITTIWKDAPVLQTLRDAGNIHGACRRCEHFTICRGCRSRAYYYGGDYLGPDPGCVIARQIQQDAAE